MTTKQELIDRLAGIPDDAVIIAPAIRTKLDAEELYEYAEGTQIELTDEQWVRVVAEYENAESFDDETLVELIGEILAT